MDYTLAELRSLIKQATILGFKDDVAFFKQKLSEVQKKEEEINHG